jgi:hypothetical protein
MTHLSEQHITTIKDAAKKLTGAKRRAFQAQVAIDYLNSNARLAEKTFGWDRKTVALGLNELRTGIVCVANFKARGNKKMEVKTPQLEADIVSLAEPKSQTSSRPVPLNEVCSIHLPILLLVRLTARGYYVIANSFAVHHQLSPSPSQNRAGTINAHGSSLEPFHKVRTD